MSATIDFKGCESDISKSGPVVTARDVGRAAIRILEIVSGADSPDTMINQIADVIRDVGGFETVTIRLRQAGDYPIMTERDHARQARHTSSLCREGDDVLTCLCGIVLNRRFDKCDLSCFTNRGGFWTNSLSGIQADRILAGVGDQSVTHGYQTQVSLPLSAAGEIIGLIQLSDRRPDLVDEDIVHHLEDLAQGLAVALSIRDKDEQQEYLDEAMRGSEVWFKAITDFSSDIVSVISGEAVIDYISPSVERELGYKAALLIGSQVLDLIHPEDLTRSRASLMKALAEPGAKFQLEAVRLAHVNGEYEYFDIAAMSAIGNVHIDGVVISSRKVTKQVRARQDLATFKAIHEAAVYGSLIFDQHGDILYLNNAYATLTGYDREELVGCNMYQLIAECDLASAREMEAVLRRDGCVPFWELKHQRRDETVLAGLVSITAVTDDAGEVLYYAANLIDISEKKKVEEELQQLNVELESRVKARTRELEDTRDRLLQSEKQTALTQLLTGFAHEINTPLGVSITAASLLEERVGIIRAEREEKDDFLTLCHDSSKLISTNLRRTAELMNTFKLLSPEQIGERRRMIWVREHICGATIEHLETLYSSGHTLEIDCAEDLRVELRPDNFAHVIGELVVNSIRHGLDGARDGGILIKAHVELDDLIVTYRDDGAGMDEETLSRVFDPFFTTRRGRMGTGLGMHIVYNLVTWALGGTIECSSRRGAGVEITIRVPLGKV
jgi:PAS domain S-box-containing protein